ncbi:DUF2812 domain-containing protein, partial [Enterococcus ureilyticus]|nr:DUF2812 domain-containing protein [Enterococcus ureilyticus]
MIGANEKKKNLYTFEKTIPKNLNYRIDYQTFEKKSDYLTYLTFFEDSGWYRVNGNCWNDSYGNLLLNNTDAANVIFSIRCNNYKKMCVKN